MKRRRTEDIAAYGYTPKARRSNKLIEVATVTSRRDPSRAWTVKLNPETTVYSCNCPSWIFRPICSDCGEALTHAGGGVLRCDKGHGTVGLPGGPSRSCKHVRAFLADQTKAMAAAMASPVERLLGALKTAADAVGIRDVLYERQWAELAKVLLPQLGALAPAATPRRDEGLMRSDDLVIGGMRSIQLDD